MLNGREHRAGRRCGASLILAAAALLAFVAPGASEWLQLDRSGIEGGQLWLLFTGHFTHWSADHFVWDLAAFIALAAFAESQSRGRMLGCVLASCLAISVGFLLFEGDLESYRGLSGVDSALFGLALAELFRRGLKMPAAIGATVFLAKIIFELTTGSAAFVAANEAGFVALPSAHLIGFLSGVAVALATQPSPAHASSHRHPSGTAPTSG